MNQAQVKWRTYIYIYQIYLWSLPLDRKPCVTLYALDLIAFNNVHKSAKKNARGPFYYHDLVKLITSDNWFVRDLITNPWSNFNCGLINSSSPSAVYVSVNRISIHSDNGLSPIRHQAII